MSETSFNGVPRHVTFTSSGPHTHTVPFSQLPEMRVPTPSSVFDNTFIEGLPRRRNSSFSKSDLRNPRRVRPGGSVGGKTRDCDHRDSCPGRNSSAPSIFSLGTRVQTVGRKLVKERYSLTNTKSRRPFGTYHPCHT